MVLILDDKVLPHGKCPVIQGNIAKSTEGERLRAFDGSGTCKAVVEVLVRRKDIFAEVVKGIVTKR